MRDKIKKTSSFIFLLAACLLFAGAWYFGYISGKNPPGEYPQTGKSNSIPDNVKDENENLTGQYDSRLHRNVGAIDFSGLKFTPWDVNAASSKINKREKKPYTIMVYMNGSDLESKMGLATKDIIEMQKSGVDADNVNIIIFTGGTNRWKNNVIPENDCMVWEITNGRIKKLTGIGLVNMGDAGTLSGFIDFSVRNFPADKFGLIMWDHGGGSIAGFGHDEKFMNGYLTLMEMNYAFEKSEIAKNKLEFLGFDSCLMATVEMAVVASNYAKYLVASEDIEPYDGWNYSFLSVLNDNPGISGAALGKTIVNYFMDYYSGRFNESLALSVTDLSKADRVMVALGGLMRQCSGSLLADRQASFRTLAARRYGTKTFGVGSPRDNECDMVDIGDMANKLSGLYPNETAQVLAALDNCVVYNRHNSDTDLKGLSAYYIYGGKRIGDMSMDTYASLNMDGDYTKYLNDFYSMLKRTDTVYTDGYPGRGSQAAALSQDETISTELTLWQPVNARPGTFIMTGIQSVTDMGTAEILKSGMNSLWPGIYGEKVCLYKINSTDKSSLYAIPAAVNGRDCDIIVAFSEEYPRGEVLGARQEDGIIIQKGYDYILTGDKIAFYYSRKNQSGNEFDWHKGREMTVEGELKLDWSEPEGGSYYSLLRTDIRHNKHFTELKALP